MALAGNGLVKLIEELGELQQIAAKKLAYPNTDNHPDNKGSMKIRLQEEIADVYASLEIVRNSYGLDIEHIFNRYQQKHELFLQWMNSNEI